MARGGVGRGSPWGREGQESRGERRCSTSSASHISLVQSPRCAVLCLQPPWCCLCNARIDVWRRRQREEGESVVMIRNVAMRLEAPSVTFNFLDLLLSSFLFFCFCPDVRSSHRAHQSSRGQRGMMSDPQCMSWRLELVGPLRLCPCSPAHSSQTKSLATDRDGKYYPDIGGMKYNFPSFVVMYKRKFLKLDVTSTVSKFPPETNKRGEQLLPCGAGPYIGLLRAPPSVCLLVSPCVCHPHPPGHPSHCVAPAHPLPPPPTLVSSTHT